MVVEPLYYLLGKVTVTFGRGVAVGSIRWSQNCVGPWNAKWPYFSIVSLMTRVTPCIRPLLTYSCPHITLSRYLSGGAHLQLPYHVTYHISIAKFICLVWTLSGMTFLKCDHSVWGARLSTLTLKLFMSASLNKTLIVFWSWHDQDIICISPFFSPLAGNCNFAEEK